MTQSSTGARAGHGPSGPSLATIESASVSCGALTYCATATVAADSGNVLAHGSVWNGEVPPGNSAGSFQIALALNTTPSEIQPGDTYLVQYRTATETVTVPMELTLYFASVPAVSSIGTGSAATSSPRTITYPASAQVYGSQQNPVMLEGGSIALSFWRPQRAAFPGEAGPTSTWATCTTASASRSPTGPTTAKRATSAISHRR